MSKKDVKKRGRGGNKIPTSWKNKFHQVNIIGPTPPLNKEGYWKQHEQEEPEIKPYEPKK